MKRMLATGSPTLAGGRFPRHPRRLGRLLEAAILAQGRLEAIQAALRVRGKVLRQRLSVLRSRGVARTIDLYDPRRRGRPCEVIALVRLSDHGRTETTRFEQSIQADNAITAASRVIGTFDYQLFAFHPDLRCAERWARNLEADAIVSRVQMTPVRTVFGHTLPGVVLHSTSRTRRGSRPDRPSRAPAIER